jgi:hypothetical protein
VANESRLRGAFMTDSGMLCLWQSAAFASIHDYDSWEEELLEDEDIIRHIQRGELVPINIRSDGSFEVEIRMGEKEALNEREKRHLLVSSMPYLFRSTGQLHVSGLEHVTAKPGSGVGSLQLKPGDYAVTIHLISWDEEPGSKDEQGKPKPDALPDFVVLLEPTSQKDRTYRTAVETFDR